jgi:signal transduction histidine kinase
MHSFLGVPIVVEGRSIGNLYLTDKRGGETFSDLDQRVVETFARHAGIAIHNARLHAEVQRLAVLQERDRIGQDLHDGIIQTLYAVGLGLEDIGELIRRDPTDAETRVEHAIDAIHATIRHGRFRDLSSLLDEGDLISGLTALAEEFRRGTLMEIELQLDEDIELGPDETLQVMQVTREALSNVARHADASRVWVTLAADADTASLSITDNGTGFDPGASRAAGHHGLNNMRVRAESLGGSFTLESAPGSSTRVLVRWPRTAAAGHEET